MFRKFRLSMSQQLSPLIFSYNENFSLEPENSTKDFLPEYSTVVGIPQQPKFVTSISNLPDEILLHVFSFLNFVDLIQSSKVRRNLSFFSSLNFIFKKTKTCKKWHELYLKADILWRKHFSSFLISSLILNLFF